MTSEERRGSAQPLHQQQKRRAWLRRASTSSDNQPPPHRSSGRRLSAYDRIIAERVRRGITVNLQRRSSVVSTASSDPESVDSSTGSSSGSGSGSRVRSGSGSTSTSGSREHSDVSLRPLAPRPDPLDETQMTSQATHREGAARCQQAGGVPLLDHLIQLAAERDSQQNPQQPAQQGQNGRAAEHPEEKRVRFREGWRSARGTGSLSALHEDEIKSVAERHAPCGILKNGRCHSKSEDKEDSVCVNGETAEKLCKNANRSAVERVAQESKLSETSGMDEAPAVPAPTENGYESDDVFEAKALTTKNASNAESTQLEVEEVSETSASIQDTNNDDEKALNSSAEPHKDTTEQTTTEEKREDSSVPKASASSDLPNELSADVEPSTSDQASTNEEKEEDQPVNLNDLTVEEISTVPETSTESSGDAQGEPATNDPEDTQAPCPLPVPSGIKPRRTRLDSVPEEPSSSPRHQTSDLASSTADQPATSAPLEAGEGAPSRPLAPTPPQLRSGRGVPSRRWSISGELTSHRRDRAAISRRLVYLTLSEEDGEPAPVFEEPNGAAVEFDPRRGEWRPLTGEEGRRLAQHRRLSLTKTCSLDFDRIP
ncbi:flocculation protein FLO11-like [Amphibalanus amphitrite]|uniref:flocculation protein FLO11-like n=1 Tax=Amphibalanus amphitrite TaxID=1232801 RepID=UPI001C91E30D|nr:flocculation protein FLO11-like [Amphibalanus amphitrite]